MVNTQVEKNKESFKKLQSNAKISKVKVEDVIYDIGGSSGTSDYEELDNKPQINNVTLKGNLSDNDLNLQGKLKAGTNITIDSDNTISASGGGGGGNTYYADESTLNLDNTNTFRIMPDYLSAVATSGNYSDLTDTPTIPSKTSELANDSDFITSAYHDSTKQDKLTAKDNTIVIDDSNNTIKGNYEAGDNITIKDNVINATAEGGTTNYENLENLPKINSNTLVGDKTSSNLGLADAEHTHDDRYYTQTEIQNLIDDLKENYTQEVIDTITLAIEEI